MLDEQGARLAIIKVKHLTGFTITDEVISQAIAMADSELANEVAQQDQLGILRVVLGPEGEEPEDAPTGDFEVVSENKGEEIFAPSRQEEDHGQR